MNLLLFWRVSLTLLLVAGICGLTSIVAANDDDDDESSALYVADELILKLVQHGDLAAVAEQYGLNPQPIDQFGSRPMYRLRIVDGVDAQVKADVMIGDPRIEYVEPNYLLEAPESQRGRRRWVIGGDAGVFAGQWSVQMLQLNEAHAISRGEGVTVAILDTGVDLNHPALAGRLIAGFDFVDFDDTPQEEGSESANPAYGHGTHVAGIVALVAPQAKIMPVRVLDADGVGNLWVLAEGLLFAADPDRNPSTNDGAQIVNLSLGTLRRTALIEDLIRELACDDDDDDEDERCLYGRGIVIVSAAGNSGDNTPHYPAAEQAANALAVAATTATDTLADFSTRGEWVQISAPGDRIVSPVPNQRYGVWSGTSMAAPHVAGAAALVRARYPNLAAHEVVQRLITTAQPIAAPAPARVAPLAALRGSAHHEATNPGSTYRLFMPLVDR